MSKPDSDLFSNTSGAPSKQDSPDTATVTVKGYPISQEYAPANNADLIKTCVNLNPDHLIAITKDSAKNPVWIETGRNESGLIHIIQRHESEFKSIGISKTDLPELLMTSVNKGKKVGYSKSDKSATVFDVNFKGHDLRISITIGSNGYIVQSNPYGKEKKIWL